MSGSVPTILALNVNRQIASSNPGPYKKEASSKNVRNSEPIIEHGPSLSQSGSRFIEYHPHLPVKKCVRRRIWGNAIDFDIYRRKLRHLGFLADG
jgi:hypothetical protein